MKEKLKKRLKISYMKKSLLNHKGVTLTELIVVFALMGIFLLMATQAITNGMAVYYRVQYQSYGIQVTDSLMAKIQGELSKAVEKVSDDEENQTQGVNLSDDGNSVDFWNGAGTHVQMTSEDGYLVVKYFGMATNDESGGNTKAVDVDDTFFKYDEKMYMGFTIRELKFLDAGDEYPDFVIKVVAVLDHPQYTGYRCERYISCYNMDLAMHPAVTQPEDPPVTPPVDPDPDDPEDPDIPDVPDVPPVDPPIDDPVDPPIDDPEDPAPEVGEHDTDVEYDLPRNPETTPGDHWDENGRHLGNLRFYLKADDKPIESWVVRVEKGKINKILSTWNCRFVKETERYFYLKYPQADEQNCIISPGKKFGEIGVQYEGEFTGFSDPIYLTLVSYRDKVPKEDIPVSFSKTQPDNIYSKEFAVKFKNEADYELDNWEITLEFDKPVNLDGNYGHNIQVLGNKKIKIKASNNGGLLLKPNEGRDIRFALSCDSDVKLVHYEVTSIFADYSK